MRALLILVLLTANARAELPGFDHTLHDGEATMRGAAAPACLDCHAMGPRARPILPGHAACFASACHVMPKDRRPDAASARLCAACHAPGKKLGKASWADSEASRDFNLRFGHDRHAAPSHAGAGKGCLTCHAAPPARPSSAPHTRCAGCHGKPETGLGMKDCERCHQAVVGRAHAPEQIGSPYSVRGRFAHDRHLSRVRDQADACLACHAEVEKSGGDQVPAPSMRGCESCHDGKKAFAALIGCRSCHAAGKALPSSEPPLRFEHRQHLPLDACASCHALRPDGQPAVIGHLACNQEACHADDFRARQAKTCGGCHVGSEPWRPLAADVGRRPASELGVEYSHRAHAGRGERTCAACHQADAAVPMRLGDGHAACAGPGCHTGASAGPSPSLSECEACHRLGLLPERDQRRRTATWAVARRFSHSRHAEKGAVDCQTCHTSAAGAARVAEVMPPGKPSCRPCHDGKTAFKMTGHGCNRCHDQETRGP